MIMGRHGRVRNADHSGGIQQGHQGHSLASHVTSCPHSVCLRPPAHCMHVRQTSPAIILAGSAGRGLLHACILLPVHQHVIIIVLHAEVEDCCMVGPVVTDAALLALMAARASPIAQHGVRCKPQ
jgi:hypothetical protein